ncbi:homoserine kinase [Feifania hominis]|uniref:Homoserine kinase n=1 Tax=Feifania hominis TaxID=2763660 RepID=A0A926DH70_9FIRM|nr:homoserine kinase [Feifania hominis]MBC8537000.1 homoserine kinase [Feifania hominis]
MIRVKVPATSANVGPGFDSLGIALDLYNFVEMQECERIVVESDAAVPTDENNLIVKTAQKLYEHCGRRFTGIHIRQENHVPMTRGLGSSSTCIAAGVLGANRLLGDPLSPQEALDFAVALEGHPDNVAPAILGGFVVSALEDGHVSCCKAALPDTLSFVGFIPDFMLSTAKARAALPKQIAHRDAVYNLSRAALMTAALLTGRHELIRTAIGDALHQPYRLPLIAGGEEVFRLSRELGALGTYISGAGPTIMSMVDKRDESFYNSAVDYIDKNLPNYRVLRFHVDNTGTQIL